MKAQMYWRYATRSLARGGQRTLLAIFCVAVGVLAIVALQLVGNAVNSGLTGNVRDINGGDLAITTSTAPLGAGDLGYFDALQSQGSISGYTAVDSQGIQLRAGTASLRMGLRAVDPAQFPLSGAPTFTDPSNATLATALQGTSVVITTTVAQALHLNVGDTAHFSAQDGRAADVTIGGIIQSAGLFQGRGVLIAQGAYAALASNSNTPVLYDEIYANVPGHTAAAATSAQSQIQAKFPLASVQSTQQALAQNQQQVSGIRYFLQIVGLLALLIGGIGIINTMQVALRRRRTEIAMLKTSGYQRRDLYALFGVEAGLIGLVGGVVGAAAGVGVSFFVKTLMENSFQIALPTTIDPLTVASGVAVGFFTALIFGLMPIVQASQVRPQAVLRELPEGAGAGSAVLSVILAGLLAVLFFALALTILQNTAVAAFAVGGTGVFLAVLSLVFGLVVLAISKLPVVESFRWWYLLLVLVAALVAAALARVAPALGILFAVPAALGIVVVLLSRTWKTNVKLALRNVGRQRARTVTTLLALFIGVFAIGLILVLGQNLKDQINSFVSSSNGPNAVIVASAADKPAVDAQLAQAAGVSGEMVNPTAQDQPVAVNGQPIAQVVQAATAGGKSTVGDVVRTINGAQGYDLANGQSPDPTTVTLVKGAQDAQAGRLLAGADAGSTAALLPEQASQAPLSLKLNDTITVTSRLAKQPVTLTIVGFYQDNRLNFEPIYADGGVVNALSGGQPQYAYRLRLDPASADLTLAKIEAAVPGVQTQSLGDFLAQITSLLNNLVVMLVAIASLAMLAGIIIIANSVTLAMLERRRELGILKAVGHTSRSVLGEVLIENGIVGFTGGVLAMIFVALATAFLGRLVFGQALGLPTTIVLAVVAVTSAACMVVAGTVASRATRVRPLEVLRYE